VIKMFNAKSCMEDCNAVSRQGGDAAGTELTVNSVSWLGQKEVEVLGAMGCAFNIRLANTAIKLINSFCFMVISLYLIK
jgi:hypothetical protein